jgi:hypothetical protein
MTWIRIENSDYCTIEDASKHLDIKYHTLYAHLNKLTKLDIGGKTLIEKNSLNQMKYNREYNKRFDERNIDL